MVTRRFATNSFRFIMKSFRCTVVSLHHKSIRCNQLFVLNRFKNSALSSFFNPFNGLKKLRETVL